MIIRLVSIAFAFLIYFHHVAIAQNFVRESLSTFLQDDSKVISLLRGVATMKARNSAPKDSAEYRTSWEYWSAIHGYAGLGPRSAPIADVKQFFENQFPDTAPFYASFYEGIQDIAPPAGSALAEEIWATCRHGSLEEPDPHFLSWHRMYLYYFERVLRAASGDPNFALPYWDYTDLGAEANEPWRMPRLFATPVLGQPGNTVPNPLYEPRRTPGFGTVVQLDTAATNIDGALALSDYFDFQAGIELGVHGHIHCAVGNGCLAPMIGIVPLAGGDPIFWHHHANIDRMWSCWLRHHGASKLPTDQAWLDTKFPFVDENGNRVELAVRDLFDPNGPINYAYDDVSATGCFRTQPTIVVASAPDSANAAIKSNGNASRLIAEKVSLTGMTAVVPLARSAGGATTQSKASSVPAGRAVLRLKNVTLASQPGVSIAIELVSRSSGKRRRIGTLSFFAQGGVAHKHSDPAAKEGGTDGLAYDVTNALSELGAASLNEVDLELRAENLVAPQAAIEASAEAYIKMGRNADGDAASVLRALDKAPDDLLTGINEPPATAIAAGGSDATTKDKAIALERVRRAKFSVGEIILGFGS